jgi:hypothetical protein
MSDKTGQPVRPIGGLVPRNNPSCNEEYYGYEKVRGLNATAIRCNQNSNSEEETNRD